MTLALECIAYFLSLATKLCRKTSHFLHDIKNQGHVSSTEDFTPVQVRFRKTSCTSRVRPVLELLVRFVSLPINFSYHQNLVFFRKDLKLHRISISPPSPTHNSESRVIFSDAKTHHGLQFAHYAVVISCAKNSQNTPMECESLPMKLRCCDLPLVLHAFLSCIMSSLTSYHYCFKNAIIWLRSRKFSSISEYRYPRFKNAGGWRPALLQDLLNGRKKKKGALPEWLGKTQFFYSSALKIKRTATSLGYVLFLSRIRLCWCNFVYCCLWSAEMFEYVFLWSSAMTRSSWVPGRRSISSNLNVLINRAQHGAWYWISFPTASCLKYDGFCEIWLCLSANKKKDGKRDVTYAAQHHKNASGDDSVCVPVIKWHDARFVRSWHSKQVLTLPRKGRGIHNLTRGWYIL